LSAVKNFLSNAQLTWEKSDQLAFFFGVMQINTTDFAEIDLENLYHPSRTTLALFLKVNSYVSLHSITQPKTKEK